MTKAELEKQVFDLRNLLAISRSLSLSLDYGQVNDSILFTCLGALGVLRAAFLSRREVDSPEFTLHRSLLGFDEQLPGPLAVPDRGPLVDHFDAHPGCTDLATLRAALGPRPELDALEALGPRVIVPLRAADAVWGLLVLGEKIDGGDFDRRDRAYLEDLAGLAALAVRNAYLFEMSTTDLLTKLRLRHVALRRLNDLIKARDPRPFSVLMIDIDFFKRVNDTSGHLAGDEVLRGVAAVVRRTLRPTDIAARYGGEEFLVVLEGVGKRAASTVAERLRKEVEAQSLGPAGRPIRVTISLGVAQFDADRDPGAAHLLDRVDHALYASKVGGRNRVTLAG